MKSPTLRPAPVEQVDDRPVARRGDDLVAARLAHRADAEFGIVGDVEHDPAFVLAARKPRACAVASSGWTWIDSRSVVNRYLAMTSSGREAGGSNQISPTWASAIDPETRVDPAPAPRLFDDLGVEFDRLRLMVFDSIGDWRALATKAASVQRGPAACPAIAMVRRPRPPRPRSPTPIGNYSRRASR